MAKPKVTADDIIKKFDSVKSIAPAKYDKEKQKPISNNNKATPTTINKGKQNNSASPTRVTADDIIKKFDSVKPTKLGVTPYKTSSKVSNTNDERNKRIKEIKSELTTLNTKLSGYSRAKAYGTSKAMLEAEENDKKRMAELSQELKTLERVGTFSASELKQFEIDDAKARESSARQKVNLFGQRPTADNAEAYRQANSELFKAQEELKKLGVKSTGEKFLDSAGYAGEKLGRGVIDGLEGITDLAWSLVGATGWGITSGFGLFENDVSRAINKWYNDINNNDITDLFGSAEERYDATPKWVKDAGWLPETIGNIVPFAVETYLSGGTTAYDDLYSAGKSAWDVGRKFLSNPDIHFGMSAGGDAIEKAIQPTYKVVGLPDGTMEEVLVKEGSNPFIATTYGVASGALEAATEKLFGGFAGLGDDFGKAGVKAFKNATGTTNQTLLKKIWNSPVTRKLLDIGTEGIEEDIVTFADPILQRATGVDSNAEWANWNDYVESGTHGVILSVVMNAVGIPISKYNKSRAISSLNHSAEILNGLTQDEAVKLQPLPNNATEEEIIARQKEVSAVALAFNNAVKNAVQTERL